MVSATALGGLAQVVQAGPAATDANGDFMVVDFEVSPPRAGTPSRRQGVTLGYHFFAGNRLPGRRPSDPQSQTIRLPGFRINGRLLAECPLPRTARELGQPRCPAATRVGGGTGEADARPLIAAPFAITVRAFNGAPRNGHSTLIFIGTAKVSGQTLSAELDFEARPGLNLTLLPAPPGTPRRLFTLSKADVSLGRIIRVRRGGQTVRRGFLESPLSCPARGWRLSQTSVFSGGATRLTATDVQPCVRP